MNQGIFCYTLHSQAKNVLVWLFPLKMSNFNMHRKVQKFCKDSNRLLLIVSEKTQTRGFFARTVLWGGFRIDKLGWLRYNGKVVAVVRMVKLINKIGRGKDWLRKDRGRTTLTPVMSNYNPPRYYKFRRIMTSNTVTQIELFLLLLHSKFQKKIFF